MSAHSTVLFVHLDRFRRRAALVIFIRSLVTAGSVAFAMAAGALLIKLMTPASAFSGAAAATAIVAAGLTIARLPTRRMTAVVADRRLQLDDRVVTAVQCAASTDAFSQLVVRDALSRLSTAEPSDVFPMRLPRMAAAGPLAIGAAILLLAAFPQMHGFSLAGGTLASRPGGAAQRSDARGDAPRRVERPAAAVSTAGSASAPTTAASKDVARAAAPTGVEGEAQAASDSHEQTRNGDSPAAATSEARSDNRGAAVPGVSPSAESRLAGGVTGTSERRDVSHETAPRAGRQYAAAYRAGRAAVETAIVQDRVPAERRTYVRAYFDSIRPRGEK